MSDTALVEWDVKPLGQLAEARRGITYSSAMLKSEEGGLPYINMKSFLKGGGFNVEGTKHYAGNFTQQDVVGERDLLIANTDVTSGDIIGVPALLPEELAAEQVLYSHHVTRLRVNGEVTVPFLYYLLCLPEYRSQMLRIARGTTVLMLDMPAIKRITIRAPKNKTEQNRIVEILSMLDKAIEKTESLIAKYQQIKAGLMHDLFTRGVTANGKLRPPREQAPEIYQETPIGCIPKEWDICALGEISDVARGKFTHRPRNDPAYYGGSYPFIQTGDVSASTGGVIYTYSQTLSDLGTTVSQCFPEGTIAITIAANIADTGILGLPMFFPDSVVGAVVGQAANRRFIELCIRRAKRHLDAIAPQSAQKNINLQDLRPLQIPLPSREEQDLIAARFESIQYKLDIEEEIRAKLSKKKLGLMSDLLTGNVRVND